MLSPRRRHSCLGVLRRRASYDANGLPPRTLFPKTSLLGWYGNGLFVRCARIRGILPARLRMRLRVFTGNTLSDRRHRLPPAASRAFSMHACLIALSLTGAQLGALYYMMPARRELARGLFVLARRDIGRLSTLVICGAMLLMMIGYMMYCTLHGDAFQAFEWRFFKFIHVYASFQRPARLLARFCRNLCKASRQ